MVAIAAIATIFIFQSATAQWGTAGNAATTSNFLGTTNNVSLRIRTNNVQRMIVDSLGRVGIGIALPKQILTVKGSGSVPSAVWVNAGAPLFAGYGETTVGNSDYILSMASSTSNARPVFIGRRGRGTLAAPTVVANNDYLMSFLSSGYDGSAFQNPAAIDFYVDGAPSAGNVPARISFVTGTNGTNRLERFKIGSTGDVSVTTGDLLLNASKTLQFANPTATSPGMTTMFTSGTSNLPRMVIAHSPAYPSWGLQYVDSVDKFDFLAGGSSVMAVNLGYGGVDINSGNLKFANGNQGIQFGTPVTGGTTGMMTMFPDGTQNPTRMVIAHSPAYPDWGLQYNDTLDQFDFVAYGTSGLNISPYSGTATAKYSFNAPYLAATSTSTSSLITSYNYGAGHGIYGYTAGGSSSDPNGISGVYGYNAGIGYGVGGYGTTGSGTYGYSSGYVGVWGSTGNTGSYAGYFQGNVYTTGTYTSSDRKLKKDIKDMTGGMDIISKLKPRTYEFRQDGNYKLMNLPEGKQYGLVAQELEEVLPNLVKQSEFDPNMVKNIGTPEKAPKAEIANNIQVNGATKKATETAGSTAQTKEEKIDFKAVNYTELIPIMIKGMQEQQAVIEEQNAKIAALTELVEKLSPGAKSALNTVEVTSAGLEQNVPNPVSNTTTIKYHLPTTVKAAQMLITDSKGSIIKTITLNNRSTGQVTLSANSLETGSYFYTLVADGRKIATKEMQMIK